MELIYNGVDIGSSITLQTANLIDSAGGRFDSIELEFEDSAGDWSRWKPALGDTVRLIQDGFDTGTCYVDGLGQRRGIFRITALSASVEVKEPRSRSWERVRFSEIVQDCADRYGFAVLMYGMDDPLYDWVGQHELPDFEFLSQRCTLEGATLKINNGTVIVWKKSVLEEREPVKGVSALDFCGTPDYNRRGDLYRVVTVSFEGISGSFTAPVGDGMDIVIPNIFVSSIAEAQRFAAGIAREHNALGETIEGTVPLDLTIAGGSLVTITGLGTGDGVYVVDEVEHHLQERQSDLTLRKRLRGY